jgi:hypothetical protein
MCAALNRAGIVDRVWTTDLVDAFMFGATSVMRAPADSGNGDKSLLNYKQPHKSEMAILKASDMAQHFGCEV